MDNPLLEKNKKKCCNGKDAIVTFLAIFTGIIVVLLAVVGIVTVVTTTGNENVKRYCVTGDNRFIGSSIYNINDRTIGWNFQYTNDLIPIVYVHVMGPIPPGQTTGPLNFAICGSPSSLACDLTIPNTLNGMIYELNPGGVSLKPIIQAIQDESHRYYLVVNNITVGNLGNEC